MTHATYWGLARHRTSFRCEPSRHPFLDPYGTGTCVGSCGTSLVPTFRLVAGRCWFRLLLDNVQSFWFQASGGAIIEEN